MRLSHQRTQDIERTRGQAWSIPGDDQPLEKEFIENSAEAFETRKIDDEAIRKQRNWYLRKLGGLEMQLDYAKQVSR